jgi:hypothetical protein
MALTTVTVSGRTATALTSATNTISLGQWGGIKVLTSASLGNVFSLHDCASVGAAGLQNLVWPINLENVAAGNPANAAITFNSGITLMTEAGDPTTLGSFQLIFS